MRQTSQTRLSDVALEKKYVLKDLGKKTCPAVPKNHHVTVQVGIFDDTNWCCSKLVLTPEFILLIPFVFKHTLGPDICESFATSSFLGGSHISHRNIGHGYGAVDSCRKKNLVTKSWELEGFGAEPHSPTATLRLWWAKRKMSHVQIFPGSSWLLGASARSWWKTWWHGAPFYS